MLAPLLKLIKNCFLRYYHLGVDEAEPYELESDKKTAMLKSPDTSSEEIVNISPLEEQSSSVLTETNVPSKECPPIKKGTTTSKSSRARSNKSQNKMPRLPKLTHQTSLPSSTGVTSKRQISTGDTRKAAARLSLFQKAASQSITTATAAAAAASAAALSNQSTPWPAKLLNKVFRRRKAAIESARCRLPPIVCHNTSTVLAPVVEESSDLSATSRTTNADTSRPTLLLLSRTSSLIVEISQSMEKNCVDGLSSIASPIAYFFFLA